MKNIFLFLFLLTFACPGASLRAKETSSKASSAQSNPLKADVVLIAVPMRARSILAGGTVSALEKPASEMPPTWTAVVFCVGRVLKGEFKIPKSQEISLWDQMKDAAEDKHLLKILAMDFEKPDESGTDQMWLSMAVIDPYASFGVREGEDAAGRQRYKLSLARVHKDPNSYVLVKSEKL